MKRASNILADWWWPSRPSLGEFLRISTQGHKANNKHWMSPFQGSCTDDISSFCSKGFFITRTSANKFCFMGERGETQLTPNLFSSIQSQSILPINMLVHCWMSKVDFVASLPLAVIRKSAFLSYRQKVLIHLDSLRLQLFLLKTSRVILLLKNS